MRIGRAWAAVAGGIFAQIIVVVLALVVMFEAVINGLALPFGYASRHGYIHSESQIARLFGLALLVSAVAACLAATFALRLMRWFLAKRRGRMGAQESGTS